MKVLAMLQALDMHRLRGTPKGICTDRNIGTWKVPDVEWIRTMKHEWENRIASFVRRYGITILNSGGKSSHGTNETANKVSGGGTGCSQKQK